MQSVARRRLLVMICLLGIVSVSSSAAQDVGQLVQTLLQNPAVRAALDRVREDEPRVLEEQAELTAIPAPPFHEAQRAEAVRRRFVDAGLDRVRVDEAGNVIGERPGTAAGPNIVVAAHLDTVFPEGTDVRVRREGQVLRAPGIADDGRGLAVLLEVARALESAPIPTRATIIFVADVGEEGLSDLRGLKQLLGGTLKGRMDAFVTIDGTGHGLVTQAVGSRRYRVTFHGPGGHSYGAFGLVNPIHALGRSVAAIANLPVPASPRVTFNVGRIGGGTSVNAIPAEAWFEIDLRSPDAAALEAIDHRFRETVERAVREENDRSEEGRITVTRELVGDRPAGRTPASAPIVQAAIAVNRALGLPVELGEASTDANLPMSLGIPAVAIGGGGRSSGGHSLAESFDATGAWKGTQAVLLLVLALAQ